MSGTIVSLEVSIFGTWTDDIALMLWVEMILRWR